MKRFTIKTLTAALLCLLALQAGAQVFVPVPPSTKARNHRQMARVAEGNVIMSENFESVSGKDPYDLPDGWVSVASPDDADDVWHASEMYRGGEQYPGVSGTKFAWIRANDYIDHDCWMISPAAELEAGQEYIVSFWVSLFGDTQKEHLQVAIGRGATAAAMTEVIYDKQADISEWTRVEYRFTPETSGRYHLGFHSLSPSTGMITLVDDVMICLPGAAIMGGDAAADFGDVLDINAPYTMDYTIRNYGTEDLRVSLQTASSEVEVEGLPLAIEPNGSKTITVKLNTEDIGTYEGTFTLKTNDPDHATVEVPVRANVTKARVTDYNYEDFEHGGPEAWYLETGVVNIAGYGVGGSRCLYATAVTGGLTAITHYIRMGGNPKIDFDLRLRKYDMMKQTVGGDCDGDNAVVHVYVSTDFGKTFTQIYAIEPNAETAYVGNGGFVHYSIDVPQVAGQTCMVAFVSELAPGKQYVNDSFLTLLDNVAIGTQPQTDLMVGTLRGDCIFYAGQEGHYTLTVSNIGLDETSDWRVRLLDGDKEVAATSGTSLQPGASTDVQVSWKATAAGAYKLKAVVDTDGDADLSNNASNDVHVAVRASGEKSVEIIDGTKEMLAPFDFYGQGVTQTIYYANELGINRGEIASLTYQTSMDAAFTSQDLTLWVGETEKDDFADSQFVPVISLTKVFSGRITFEKGKHQMVVPFDTPYQYNGRNLVVYATNINPEFFLYKLFLGAESKGVARTIVSQLNSHLELTELTPANGDVSAKELYPNVSISMVKPETGKLTGVVSDANGPVEGVKVSIDGTCLYATTNAAGEYSLPRIAVGTYAIRASKHGYADAVAEDVEIVASGKHTADLQLTAVTTFSVKGSVLSESGKAIEGATVTLKGYDTYQAKTDGEGHFTLTDVYGSSEAYAVSVSCPFYLSTASTISVGENISDLAYTLAEAIYPVTDVVAERHADGAYLTWQQPMPMFRYDSGERNGELGWDTANETFIMGTCFRRSAKLYEAQWMQTSALDTHESVTLYVFDLDSDGLPTRNILYQATVPTTDDVWSSYRFPKPVVAKNGFLLAFGSAGFISIATSLATSEYPLEPGMHYSNSGFHDAHFLDMSTYANVHLMIRAVGEDYGEPGASQTAYTGTRPDVTYTVYRLRAGDEVENWEIVADEESETSFIDEDFATVNEGQWQWAVVANYALAEADAVKSNVVNAAATGISQPIRHTQDADTRVYDLQGRAINPQAAATAKGIYIVKGKKVKK